MTMTDQSALESLLLLWMVLGYRELDSPAQGLQILEKNAKEKVGGPEWRGEYSDRGETDPWPLPTNCG